MKFVRWLAKPLILIAVSIVVVASDNDLVMLPGSDAASLVIAPPVAIQILGVALVALCLFLQARPATRGVLLGVAIVSALLAGHRLVIDHLHNELRDVYLAATIQRLALDPALEGGLDVHPVVAGFTIEQSGGPQSMRVISPPLIGLDRAVLHQVAE